MSKPAVHWRPTTAISYPSGPGTMRTFVLRGNIPCPASRGLPDWSEEPKWVTCKRCLKIHAMHRADTNETIEAVLRRPDPLAEEPTNGGKQHG